MEEGEKLSKGINKKNINFRYNIITIFTYLIGIVLIIQLFNLQIIHGTEYREQSNTRLTRESVLEAARGEILDRSGNVLVTSGQKFNLKLYKTKIDTRTLNNTILKIINVLEKYEVKYTDSFPISIDPFEFKITDKTLTKWKEDNRIKESISLTNMEELLKKINDYTDYVYLHVKGEPLLHPKLKEILDLCEKYHKKVNITTNATLIKEKESILNHSAIRQINLSVHSENKKVNYLEEIFEVVDKLKDKNIVYRFWTMEDNNLSKEFTELVEKIINHYQLSPEIVEKLKTENNIKINSHTYVNKANEFIWPDINNDYNKELGYCYALKDQLAILVDGTIVPCCLDSNGVINLGNIYQNDLLQVINSSHYQKIRMGFCNRKVTEELCKHCSYKERFDIK